MPNYNEIITFGKEIKRPPSVKERMIDFIRQHPNEYFTKEDIWSVLKGKPCYYSTSNSIFEAGRTTMLAILQGWFVVGFLEKNIKEYKNKVYVLYNVSKLGKEEFGI